MTEEEKKEKARQRAHDWYHANKERGKQSRKTWREANKAHISAHEKERRFKMTEEERAKRREYQNRWNAKNRETVRRISRAQYHKHKAKRQDTRLKELYGITHEQRTIMERLQGGCCAICERPPNGRWRQLHVDHCHTTGVVRGLLCYRCNSLIGYAKDSIRTLQRAIKYLGVPQ